jgi:hypothetical protein
MRALALLLCGAAALAATGCKSGSKRERLRRSTDAAAVEVVTQPDPAAKLLATALEVEPNDAAAGATPLAFDTAMRGDLATATDVDRYHLSVTKAGALTVAVSALAGVDVVMELRDLDDAVVAKSDRGGAKVEEGIGGFPVSAGSYDVVLRAFVKPSRPLRKGAKVDDTPSPTAPAEPYELTATLTEAGGAGGELEPNGDAGTANDLAIGETVTGKLGWSGDVDVWKISTDVLAASDVLDLTLSAIDGVTPTIELQDGMSRPQALRKGSRGKALSVQGWRPDPEATPRFLYVLLRGERSHPAQAYELRVTGRAVGVGDEVEPNDSVERAQALAEPGALQARWDDSDVDCYAVPVADVLRWIQVAIEGEAASNLAAEVLVGGAVAKHDLGPGRSEQGLVEVPAGVVAVIRVRGTAKPGAPGPYQLRWREGDAMPPEERSAPP